MGEAFLLTFGGVLLGAMIAAAASSSRETTIVQRYGLNLSDGAFSADVLRVLGALLAAGLVAGLLPALRCYRRSLADGLSPDVGG